MEEELEIILKKISRINRHREPDKYNRLFKQYKKVYRSIYDISPFTY